MLFCELLKGNVISTKELDLCGDEGIQRQFKRERCRNDKWVSEK